MVHLFLFNHISLCLILLVLMLFFCCTWRCSGHISVFVLSSDSWGAWNQYQASFKLVGPLQYKHILTTLWPPMFLRGGLVHFWCSRASPKSICSQKCWGILHELRASQVPLPLYYMSAPILY